MANGVYFNGRFTRVPGSYSKVDASGMASVGLGATGIVACIGTAIGGQPLALLRAPVASRAAQLFRSGDLLEANQILFDPSVDPNIPGGAREVVYVKVNPSTQSELTLPNADGDALALTSVDYGVHTGQIGVEVGDGTNVGRMVRVTFGSTVEVVDDIVGGGVRFTVEPFGPMDGGGMLLMFNTPTAEMDSFIPVAYQPPPNCLAASLSWGSPTEATGLTYGRLTPAPVSSMSAAVTAGSTVTIVSNNAADTQTYVVYGEETGSGNAVSETLVMDGVTPVVGSTAFDVVYGIVQPDGTSATGTVLATSTTGAQTLATFTNVSATQSGAHPALVAPGGTGDAFWVVASGSCTDVVMLAGTDTNDDPQFELITLNGTTAVRTTLQWSTVLWLMTSAVTGGRTVDLRGRLWPIFGDAVTIVSTNAADTTQTAVIYGRSTGGAPQSESVALNGTTPVSGIATFGEVWGVSLSAACAGDVRYYDASPRILANTTIAAGDFITDGMCLPSQAVTPPAPVVGIADGPYTGDILVFGVAGGVAAGERIVANGATATETTADWSHITAWLSPWADLDTTGVQRAVSISLWRCSALLGTATLQQVVDYVGAIPGWAAELTDPSAAIVAVSDLDDVLTPIPDSVFFPTEAPDPVTVEAGLAGMVARINRESALVTASEATAATGAPDNTAVIQFLAGGVDGTAGFSDYQAALDLLRNAEVNTIVALTSDAAVHAAVESHCRYMAGPGADERDAVLGAAVGETYAQLDARSLSLTSRHVRLVTQTISRYNTAGVLTAYPPYLGAACAVAGMQSGSPVGTSLTWKYPKAVSVRVETTYNPVEDAEQLIQSGLLVLTLVPGKGYRWLRNITTYRLDDNLAYVEASVNEAANFATKSFRRAVEIAVGQPGFASTVAAVKGVALNVLGQLVHAGTVVTWRNLTITLAADTMTIDVELAPVTPVNFVLSTLHLVTAEFAAAA